MKKCIKCLKNKPINEYYNDRQNFNVCRECRNKEVCKWIKNNKEKKTKKDYLYNNSLRGFLVNAFNGIIKRSKKRKDRKIIEVNLTKKEFFEEFLLHVERFGMNCRYTGVALTHISRSGKGIQKDRIKTNISVDRIDNTLPYQVNNIAFCSGEFNDRKGSVTIDDCKKILKVYEERKLELEEDGYYETQS
jgi:hypothetical protein